MPLAPTHFAQPATHPLRIAMSCHLSRTVPIYKIFDSPADCVVLCAVDYIACPFLASLDVNIGHDIYNQQQQQKIML